MNKRIIMIIMEKIQKETIKKNNNEIKIKVVKIVRNIIFLQFYLKKNRRKKKVNISIWSPYKTSVSWTRMVILILVEILKLLPVLLSSQ